MTISINVGDAFLVETFPNGSHLYIAIAFTKDNKYLFVNVTTRRDLSDTSCIISPNTRGIPSFISKESVIDYFYAEEWDADQLACLLDRNSTLTTWYFDSDLVTQIQQGGISSKNLKRKYKKALKAYLELS